MLRSGCQQAQADFGQNRAAKARNAAKVCRMESQKEGATGVCARGSARESLFLLTMLCDVNGRELGAVRIRNLSSAGMMADFVRAPRVMPPPATAIRFSLRGVGEVSGAVVRVNGAHMGIRFDREIDPRLARRSIGKAARPVRRVPGGHNQTF